MRFNNRSTTSTSRNKLLLCFRTKARQRFNLFQTCSHLEATCKFIFTTTDEVHVSIDYLLFNNRNLFIFTEKKEGIY